MHSPLRLLLGWLFCARSNETKKSNGRILEGQATTILVTNKGKNETRTLLLSAQLNDRSLGSFANASSLCLFLLLCVELRLPNKNRKKRIVSTRQQQQQRSGLPLLGVAVVAVTSGRLSVCTDYRTVKKTKTAERHRSNDFFCAKRRLDAH